MDTIENLPILSVCVVTYNQEKYIRQCLQSILDQEIDFEFELIVGDDFSSDGTRDVIKDLKDIYKNRITTLFHEKNTGGMGNYLSVHRAARGKYVCHVDGDDWISPGKLAAQVNYLENNINCSMVAHRMSIWESEVKVASTRFNPEIIDLNMLLLKHPMFLHSSTMYRRRSIDEIFHKDIRYIDFYVYINAALNGYIGFLNKEFGNYRRNIGISSKLDLMPDIVFAIDAAAKVIGETPVVYRCRAKQYMSYGVANLLRGNTSEFRKYIALARSSDKHWILPKLIDMASVFPGALKFSVSLYKGIRNI